MIFSFRRSRRSIPGIIERERMHTLIAGERRKCSEFVRFAKGIVSINLRVNDEPDDSSDFDGEDSLNR